MVRPKVVPLQLSVDSRSRSSWSLTGKELSFENGIYKFEPSEVHTPPPIADEPQKTPRKNRRINTDHLFKISVYISNFVDLSKYHQLCLLKSTLSSGKEKLIIFLSEFHTLVPLTFVYDIFNDNFIVRSAESFSPEFELTDEIFPELEVLTSLCSLSRNGLTVSLDIDGFNFKLLVLLEKSSVDDSCQSPSLPPPLKFRSGHWRTLMNHIFSPSPCISPNHSDVSCGVVDCDDMARLLTAASTGQCDPDEDCSDHSQHPALVPTMRPYQLAAVRWMLRRERTPLPAFVNSSDASLHCLFQPVETLCGQTLYLNMYSGELRSSKPIPVSLRPGLPAAPGGILADEMGLGKTIEILDLILHNPRPQVSEEDTTSEIVRDFDDGSSSSSAGSGASSTSFDDVDLQCICGKLEWSKRDQRSLGVPIKCIKCFTWQHLKCVNLKRPKQTPEEIENISINYICPYCISQVTTPVRGKATLVISPSAIASQWDAEIQKHVTRDALQVLVYTGVRSRQGFLQPDQLAAHDVVITTYEVLKLELNHVDLHQDNLPVSPAKPSGSSSSRLRSQKRYRALPTPLTCIEWWRVCVDEAQLINCHTARASDMILRLPAVNRWCVTGTPIARQFQDLYGLLLFLGVDPVCYKHWWQELVVTPALSDPPDSGMLLDVIRSCMWRTEKRQVRQQLGIPDQHVKEHLLTLSPIESHFYERKKISCKNAGLLVMSKVDDDSLMLQSLDRSLVQKVLRPLTELRKACIHPQMVRGHVIGVTTKLMSMDEVLSDMIGRTVLECEESLRLVCFCTNGIAGTYLLDNNMQSAVENYREVLRLVEINQKEGVRTDPLPQIHTLYNLHRVLVENPGVVAPTLRDDSLLSQFEDLRASYLKAFKNDVDKSLTSLKLITEKITSIDSLFEEDTWFVQVSEELTELQEDALIDKIYAELQKTQQSVQQSFRNISGLQYLLTSQFSRVTSLREEVTQKVRELDVTPTDEIIRLCYDCHLRPDATQSTPRKLKCKFCRVHDRLVTYENCIFTSSHKRLYEEDEADSATAALTWAPSALEVMCTAISGFCATAGFSEAAVHQSKCARDVLALFRKEFKELRVHWRALYDRVSGYDELNMAMLRFRIREPHEDKRPELKNVLEPGSVGVTRMKLESDLQFHESELSDQKGRKAYLQNLAKARATTANLDPCPICQAELGTQWAVFSCGHNYCHNCVVLLISRVPGANSETPLLGGRSLCVKCPVCRQPTPVPAINYVDTEKANDPDDDVKGGLSTKVHAIVKEIKSVLREDHTSKILVFTAWKEVLSILSSALEMNGVASVLLETGPKFQSQLGLFKRDSSIPVCLLLYKSCSSGLNITEANHVMIVEPVLTPSLVHQAVGRVDRISQTRETTVHLFLIRDSIEANISKIIPQIQHRTESTKADTTPALSLHSVKSLLL